jgi:GntR family transcriptional regulator / MocR family aminotransferase
MPEVDCGQAQELLGQTVRSPNRNDVVIDLRHHVIEPIPTQMRTVREIYRYPIKGLSPQALLGITLEAGKPFPFDRVFALTRPGLAMAYDGPRWAKKGLFLMLMLEDTLAQVHTELDPQTLKLTIRNIGARGSGGASDTPLLCADLSSAAGRLAVEEFFRSQVPTLAAAPRLVHAPTGHFMDKPDNVMSCINLATVRSLEALWGHSVHPLRFRANFYIEGLRPWEEFEWVGSNIEIGDVLFRVDRRNGRCGATNVNPATGQRDLDIPAALRKSFGHKDLGVYLVAQSTGKVVVGDPVAVPNVKHDAMDQPAFVPPLPDNETFICRGCYYIYEQNEGAPGVSPGTPFAAIPDDWRCPDCGTEKATFRRYWAAGSADAAAVSATSP